MKNLKTELLIIIFLWANVIFSLINLQSAEVFLIIGIIGLTICSILFKFNNRLCNIILAFLLALGSISLISFNDAFQMTFMGFINILNVLLFAILIFNKRTLFSEIKDDWFGESKEDIVEKRRSKTEFFRKKFENLPTEELKNKMNEDLVPEAKKAIRNSDFPKFEIIFKKPIAKS